MRTLSAFILCCALLACGKAEEKPPVKLFESQRQELDKAKQFEQTLQKTTEARQQAIDQQAASDVGQ